MKLENKISIITGAASGIGKATAILFGEEGSTVVVADIDMEGARKTADEMREKGGRAFPVKVDLSDIGDIQSTVLDIKEKFGDIHILVNNAGVFSKVQIQDMTEEEWDRVMDINLKGAFFLSKEVLPMMIKQQYGKIVNVSSLSAKRGGFTSGVNYGVSKAGLISVTKYMANFGGRYGINVNAIVPGFVDTEMFQNHPEEKKKAVIKSIPIGRIARKEEIAKAIMFLSSEDSSYITGEILDINGGVLMD
ncbi:MAG TPA: SDR family oxidoreductase [Spirochaetes bacterium]|nr:SDR family oxidoreductase [Spirochaetota bacterium]